MQKGTYLRDPLARRLTETMPAVSGYFVRTSFYSHPSVVAWVGFNVLGGVYYINSWIHGGHYSSHYTAEHTLLCLPPWTLPWPHHVTLPLGEYNLNLFQKSILLNMKFLKEFENCTLPNGPYMNSWKIFEFEFLKHDVENLKLPFAFLNFFSTNCHMHDNNITL